MKSLKTSVEVRQPKRGHTKTEEDARNRNHPMPSPQRIAKGKKRTHRRCQNEECPLTKATRESSREEEDRQEMPERGMPPCQAHKGELKGRRGQRGRCQK